MKNICEHSLVWMMVAGVILLCAFVLAMQAIDEYVRYCCTMASL